jgi:hypothetical protein
VKHAKELGNTLRLAGVTKTRKSVGDGKKRHYVLPASTTAMTWRT